MVSHQLDPTIRSASGALATMARSCRYWIEQFHQDYLQRGKKEETWLGDYWKVLKRLPQGEFEQASKDGFLHRNISTKSAICLEAFMVAHLAPCLYPG